MSRKETETEPTSAQMSRKETETVLATTFFAGTLHPEMLLGETLPADKILAEILLACPVY